MNCETLYHAPPMLACFGNLLSINEAAEFLGYSVSGDLDYARSMIGEYHQQIEEKRKARVSEIDEQMDALRRQRDELAPPVVEHGGKTLRYLDEQQTREFDERRRAQEAK